MTRRLIRNRARCQRCDTVLESKHRHDFQSCSCGNFVDGGTSCVRRGIREGGQFAELLDMSEWEEA